VANRIDVPVVLGQHLEGNRPTDLGIGVYRTIGQIA